MIDDSMYVAAHGNSPEMDTDGHWRFTDRPGGETVIVEYTGEYHNAQTTVWDHFGHDKIAYLMA